MDLIAVCPGSFDPITTGHLDIIERASVMFAKVIVGVAINPAKKPLFGIDDRVDMAKEAITAAIDRANIEVEAFDSLLIEFANKHEARVIVKGLRAVTDFEHEFQMAQLNRVMAPSIETIFLMANAPYTYLSSSAIREIAYYGGNIKGLVPENVELRLSRHFNS